MSFEKFVDWFSRPATKGWMVVLGVCILISLGGTGLNLRNTTTHTLQQAIHSQCIATNITRALDNVSHQSDWDFETLQIQHQRQTQKADLSAFRKLGVSAKLLQHAQVLQNQELASEQADANSKTWSQLSDCNSVRGASELEVHAFAEKTPPSSQLSLLNAIKPDPRGSLNVSPGIKIQK